MKQGEAESLSLKRSKGGIAAAGQESTAREERQAQLRKKIKEHACRSCMRADNCRMREVL
jgi:hypothetical protein